MRNNRVWGKSLETITLSDLMRLSISIYTSFDQQEPEVEINHPHNSDTISLYFFKEIRGAMKD